MTIFVTLSLDHLLDILLLHPGFLSGQHVFQDEIVPSDSLQDTT